MRLVLTAALLAATASPALAEPRHAPHVSPEQAAAALQNPLIQEAGARTLAQLVGIVLDTRIGAAGPLIAPDADVRSNDTLRDLAERHDPRFEEHLHQNTRHALHEAGAVAGGAAAQAKELKRTADRLQAALSPLLAALASNRE